MKVTDTGADYIVKCKNLKSLDIFHTSISTEGKANILVKLKNLEELPRGDFLCDALDHIEESNPDIINR